MGGALLSLEQNVQASCDDGSSSYKWKYVEHAVDMIVQSKNSMMDSLSTSSASIITSGEICTAVAYKLLPAIINTWDSQRDAKQESRGDIINQIEQQFGLVSCLLFQEMLSFQSRAIQIFCESSTTVSPSLRRQASSNPTSPIVTSDKLRHSEINDSLDINNISFRIS